MRLFLLLAVLRSLGAFWLGWQGVAQSCTLAIPACNSTMALRGTAAYQGRLAQVKDAYFKF
jgi:hypothetical protein